MSEFVSALREFAPDSDFLVDYLKRELALQILSRCRSTKAHECMLLAAIDLDEYIKILESDESLQGDWCVFAAAAGGYPTPTVHGVQYTYKQCSGQKTGNANKGVQQLKLNSRGGKCYACG